MNELKGDLPEGFKLTELGPLPEEWEVVKLGDVAEVSSGGSAPQGDEYFKGSKPFVRVSHIDNEDYTIKRYDLISDKAIQDYRLKLFPKGTIVFPKSGATIYLEKRAMLPIDAYVVSHLCTVLSKREDLSQCFLFYVLRNLKFAKEKADGYPTLNISEIKQILIPLPPLSEQKKIAAVLSAVQEAKEKTEAVINAARDLKKSMMSYLFTYGPVPLLEAENVPLKETEVGMIPEEWEVVTIENSVESIEYGYSISIPENESERGIYIVSTADITKDGKILYNYIRKITPPKKLTERLILKDGDILFNWRNSPELIGKTAIFEQSPTDNHIYTYASFILRIRCDGKNSHNVYIKYILNYYREKGVFLKLARRAVNQANYNRNEIKALQIPLPPLPTQQKIASILSAIDQKIEAEDDKKKALEDLFKTLLHNLMTAKIRVNNLEVGA